MSSPTPRRGLTNTQQALLAGLAIFFAVLGGQFAVMQTVTVQGIGVAICASAVIAIKELLGSMPTVTP